MSLDRLHRMKRPIAKFVATEEALTVSTELGASTAPWTNWTGISEHPGFWLLRTSPGAALTLPIGGVAVEALAFIRRKVAGTNA
jgi:hypothetical protein